MSLPEDLQILKELQKPDLKYQLGDLIYLKSDLKKQYAMTITNFQIEDYNCTDYQVEWLNSQGTMQHDNFPEECLILIEPEK